MEEKKFIVYMHTNTLNNKKYIGITKQSLKDRCKNGFGYKSKTSHLWKAIEKYGWDKFQSEIIYENVTFENALFYEMELIATYQTNNPKYGYNGSAGGKGSLGFIPTEETRQKMRQSRLNYYNKNKIQPGTKFFYDGIKEEYKNIPIFRLCQQLNKKYSLIMRRWNRGWSWDQALEFVEKPKYKMSKETIEKQILVRSKWLYDGQIKEYLNIPVATLCKQYNMCYTTVKQRVNLRGWTIDEALGIIPLPRHTKKNFKHKYIYNGKMEEYQNIPIRHLCKKLNIDYQIVKARLQNNWTYDEALEFEEKITIRKNLKLIYNGQFQEYLGLPLPYLSKKLKINFNTVRTRLSRKWTHDEALELIPRKTI